MYKLRLIKFFKQLHFSSIVRFFNLNQPPIIICGCPRSGTTILQSMLSAHPKIQAISAESRIFRSYPFRIKFLNQIVHRLKVLNHLLRAPIKPKADRWLEKTPTNVLEIQNILEEFDSKVKIIHIVRDGRDVITSFHPSKPNEYFVAPQQWVKLVKSGLKWKQHPSVLTLKYEDLILKKENTMVLLLDFLALDASPKMLNFPLYTTLKQPNSLMDKVSDLNAKSINKWKRLNHDKRIAMFNGIDEAVRLNSKLGY